MAQSKRYQRPILLGALIAPLIAPLAAAPAALLIQPDIYGSFAGALILFPFVAIFSILFSYAATLFFGIPAFLVLSMRYQPTSFAVTILGAGIGAALWAGLSLKNAQVSSGDLPATAAFGAIVGGVVAFAFSCVCEPIVRSRGVWGERRLPNKDASTGSRLMER